jgi:hypothetical protein
MEIATHEGWSAIEFDFGARIWHSACSAACEAEIISWYPGDLSDIDSHYGGVDATCAACGKFVEAVDTDA